MMTEFDLELNDGRTVHAYDSGAPSAGSSLCVLWHHGTPQTGLLPDPLLDLAERCGIRWLSYDRPGYGGSSAQPGRSVAAAAGDVQRIVDELGVDRFAVMGASGGGPHALACAAALPNRVIGVVSVAGLAPYPAGGLDWFAGMAAGGAAELHASVSGRAELQQVLETAEFDPDSFIPADYAALNDAWSSVGKAAGLATAAGTPAGMVDDDLAYVAPWGFDVAQVTAPTLLLHGESDRVVPSSHGRWLAQHCPPAELWLRPDDGHISVLSGSADAIAWLAEQAST